MERQTESTMRGTEIGLASMALATWLGLLIAVGSAEGEPTWQDVISSKSDLWGESALRAPGGPSYEFFAKLLPPLRYVDAPYKHSPIVLAAPRSLVKGKIVSNGSIINPLARRAIWTHEAGIPWHV